MKYGVDFRAYFLLLIISLGKQNHVKGKNLLFSLFGWGLFPLFILFSFFCCWKFMQSRFVFSIAVGYTKVGIYTRFCCDWYLVNLNIFYYNMLNIFYHNLKSKFRTCWELYPSCLNHSIIAVVIHQFNLHKI